MNVKRVARSASPESRDHTHLGHTRVLLVVYMNLHQACGIFTFTLHFWIKFIPQYSEFME